MGAQYYYWGAGAILLLIAVIAAFADRRRQNRHDIDAIGWVPWRGVMVAAAFAMVADLILAIKVG